MLRRARVTQRAVAFPGALDCGQMVHSMRANERHLEDECRARARLHPRALRAQRGPVGAGRSARESIWCDVCVTHHDTMPCRGDARRSCQDETMRTLLLDTDFEADDADRFAFTSMVSAFDYDVVIWDPVGTSNRYEGMYRGEYRGRPAPTEAESVALIEAMTRRKQEFTDFLDAMSG